MGCRHYRWQISWLCLQEVPATFGLWEGPSWVTSDLGHSGGVPWHFAAMPSIQYASDIAPVGGLSQLVPLHSPVRGGPVGSLAFGVTGACRRGDGLDLCRNIRCASGCPLAPSTGWTPVHFDLGRGEAMVEMGEDHQPRP